MWNLKSPQTSESKKKKKTSENRNSFTVIENVVLEREEGIGQCRVRGLRGASCCV